VSFQYQNCPSEASGSKWTCQGISVHPSLKVPAAVALPLQIAVTGCRSNILMDTARLSYVQRVPSAKKESGVAEYAGSTPESASPQPLGPQSLDKKSHPCWNPYWLNTAVQIAWSATVHVVFSHRGLHSPEAGSLVGSSIPARILE
jgi:hypothetical protein